MKSLKSFSVTRFSVLMLIISTCATSLTVQGAMIELAQITGPDDKETLAKQEKVINKASVFLEIYKNRLMMDMHQPPHIRPPGVYVIPRDVEWQSAKTYSLLFKHFGRDAVRKIYEFYVGKGGAAQLPKTEIAAKYNVMIASFLAYEAANGPLYTTRDNIVYAKGDERLDLLPLKVRNFLEQNQIKLVQYDHRNPQSKKYLYNYHVPTGTSFPIPHEIEASIWQRNYDSHHYPAQFVTEICCQRQNKNGLDTLFFWNPISQNSRSIALPIEFQKIQATTKFSVQNPTNPNESITLLDESHTHHIPIATIKEVDANTLFLQRGQCHSLRYTKIPYDKENVFTIDKYTGTVVTKKCITQEDEEQGRKAANRQVTRQIDFTFFLDDWQNFCIEMTRGPKSDSIILEAAILNNFTRLKAGKKKDRSFRQVQCGMGYGIFLRMNNDRFAFTNEHHQLGLFSKVKFDMCYQPIHRRQQATKEQIAQENYLVKGYGFHYLETLLKHGTTHLDFLKFPNAQKKM